MLGVAHAGVVGAVNNPDASQIIIRRQIAQFHWEPPAWFVADPPDTTVPQQKPGRRLNQTLLKKFKICQPPNIFGFSYTYMDYESC